MNQFSLSWLYTLIFEYVSYFFLHIFKNTTNKKFSLVLFPCFPFGINSALRVTMLNLSFLLQVLETIPLKWEQRQHLSISFLIEAKQWERKFQPLELG